MDYLSPGEDLTGLEEIAEPGDLGCVLGGDVNPRHRCSPPLPGHRKPAGCSSVFRAPGPGARRGRRYRGLSPGSPPVGRASCVARRTVEIDGRGRPPVRTILLQRAPVRDERVVSELSTAEDAALIAPLACPAAPGADGVRALVAEVDADEPGHVRPPVSPSARFCQR